MEVALARSPAWHEDGAGLLHVSAKFEGRDLESGELVLSEWLAESELLTILHGLAWDEPQEP